MWKYFILLSAVVLSGCALTPTDRTPRIQAPVSWLAQADPLAATATEMPVPDQNRTTGAWWLAFNDPVLDRLMILAEANNPDLERARARLREARSQAIAVGARLGPSLDAVTTISRSRTDPVGREQRISLFEAAFDARWETDIFGANASRAEAAGALADAAAWSTEGVLRSLRAEVARTYIILRATQKRIVLTKNAVAAWRDTANLARSLNAAGVRSAFDSVQAEASVQSLSAAIPLLIEEATAASRRLDTLLGEQPGHLAGALDAVLPVPVPTSPAVLDTPAAVLARRPDLRQAEQELAAAHQLSAAAMADLYPKLNLAVLFGLRESVPGEQLNVWSLGAGLIGPLLNNGRLRAEADAAEARREQALHGFRQQVFAALEDVETSLTSYLQAEHHRASVSMWAEHEQDRNTLATSRYTAGVHSFLEVLDAQRALLAAQTAEVAARARVATSYVALNKALGG